MVLGGEAIANVPFGLGFPGRVTSPVGHALTGRSGWLIRPPRVTAPRRSPSTALCRSITSQPRCSAMVSSIVGPTARRGRLPSGAPAVDSSATRTPWRAGCLHWPAMKIDRKMLRRSWESWVSVNLEVSGPYWLQLMWTALFSAALALGVTVMGFAIHADSLADWLRANRWLFWLGRNLVVSLVIGYAIHGLFELVGRLVGPARICRFTALQRVLSCGGIPIVALGAGWPLGIWLAAGTVRRDGDIGPVATAAAIALLVTFVTYHWFGAKARAIDAERRATAAQLKLLQPQIEPHFLFNTLAHVHSLIDQDAAKARAMLGAFTDYLRASLGGLRRDEVTLGEELALAEAYLRAQATRMEERLRFSIEADEATRRTPLLPLLLQPLVENAVLHGLEPQLEGGSVSVRVRTEGDAVVVEVRDDGRGPDAPAETVRRRGRRCRWCMLPATVSRPQSASPRCGPTSRSSTSRCPGSRGWRSPRVSRGRRASSSSPPTKSTRSRPSSARRWTMF
jgi:two-component sensor histidine kinase